MSHLSPLSFIVLFIALPHPLNASETIFSSNFGSDDWFKQFNAYKTPPKVTGLEYTERVFDTGKKAYVLKVRFPEGSFDLHDGGAYWRTYLKRPVEKATISYDVKFENGFGFVLGGKLPGLAGGGKEKAPTEFVAGGEKPTGANGWSVRLMWRENGRAENYAYYANMPTTYGKRFAWHNPKGEAIHLKAGKWYHVESQVILNDPDKSNGAITTSLDGVQVVHAEQLKFRTTDKLLIDSIHFSTFFGGDTLDWAAQKNEAIYFDSFRVVAD